VTPPKLFLLCLIVGTQLDYTKHCQLEFGANVQTHKEHDNSMATRTTGAIAFRPTGNEQGGYYFFSLTTGRVLNRNRLTQLLMPSEVIDRVHVLARRGPSGGLGLVFGNRNGAPTITDLDDTNYSDDKSYHPPDPDADYFDSDDYTDIDAPDKTTTKLLLTLTMLMMTSLTTPTTLTRPKISMFPPTCTHRRSIRRSSR
jgi:hypothetical protein